MKTIIQRSALLCIFSFLFASVMWAQELPQAQKNLQRFVGNWVSKNISMTMGDKTYGGEYTFNCKTAIDGNGIYAEESYEDPDFGKLHGLNIANYDPAQQNIHWYSIDNLGTCHDHIGYWTDRDHFYMQWQGNAEGAVLVEKIYFTFLNDNKVEFRLILENNGVITQKGVGEFVKK